MALYFILSESPFKVSNKDKDFAPMFLITLSLLYNSAKTDICLILPI